MEMRHDMVFRKRGVEDAGDVFRIGNGSGVQGVCHCVGLGETRTYDLDRV